MAWKLEGTYFETCSCEVVTRSRISAFGIEYEGKAGFSASAGSWAA